jgi:hypothetical protein
MEPRCRSLYRSMYVPNYQHRVSRPIVQRVTVVCITLLLVSLDTVADWEAVDKIERLCVMMDRRRTKYSYVAYRLFASTLRTLGGWLSTKFIRLPGILKLYVVCFRPSGIDYIMCRVRMIYRMECYTYDTVDIRIWHLVYTWKE